MQHHLNTSRECETYNAGLEKFIRDGRKETLGLNEDTLKREKKTEHKRGSCMASAGMHWAQNSPL